MGMDFVALMKYGGPDNRVMRALNWLDADSPPEIKALVPLFQQHGFSIGSQEETAWEYHHRPDLHDQRVGYRPMLPKLGAALHTQEDFFLTFGADAFEVYHLLRWRFFLTDPGLQQAMLGACSYLARLFGATDCIITSDYNPVVHAFREGKRFDASVAAAGPEGECSSLVQLASVWDRDDSTPQEWDQHNQQYWRLPLKKEADDPSIEWKTLPSRNRGRAGVILLDEHGWEVSEDPQAMLETLLRQDNVSRRKLRLWACACVRRIWLLLHANSRKAVEVVERFVDGHARQQEVDHWAEAAASVRKGNRRANEAAELTTRLCSERTELSRLYSATLEFPPSHVSEAVVDAVVGRNGQQHARPAERMEHADLLRDIFSPNPFRTVTIDPSWRTSTVIGLAEAIYKDRNLPKGQLDVTRLGVVADALEDAGCHDNIVLRHLRDYQVHVRGCWVIDLLLSKK